jgi:hypothetical protein
VRAWIPVFFTASAEAEGLSHVPVPRKGAARPMLAKLNTFSLLGIEALPVEVEVDVSPAGLPKTVLVV